MLDYPEWAVAWDTLVVKAYSLFFLELLELQGESSVQTLTDLNGEEVKRRLQPQPGT